MFKGKTNNYDYTFTRDTILKILKLLKKIYLSFFMIKSGFYACQFLYLV